MPRKTDGSGTTSRRKKAVASIEPPAGQVVPDGNNGKSIDLREEIRRRAYELYLERRGTAGNEHQDWLLAEREVRARHQQGYSA